MMYDEQIPEEIDVENEDEIQLYHHADTRNLGKLN
jgi:hypothetical protein